MTELQNRSLDRGISILETLARKGACSLAELHRETSLPKSTIRRLLGTLLQRRFIRRSLSDQKYRINIGLPTSAGEPVPPELAILVDVAMPILTELTQQVQWPSDLQLAEGNYMRIVDSTRPLSPYFLYRGIVNRRLNTFGSATGQACLSVMDKPLIQRLIADTTGDQTWGLDRFGIDELTLFRSLETAKNRGYGTRLSVYTGETLLDDGLSAIAVPVGAINHTFGAISLLFPRQLMTTEKFAASNLKSLQKAAARITKDLAHYDTPPRDD